MTATIELRPHPRGESGSKLSLAEVARYAAMDRTVPKIREWTLGVLRDAGNPRDARRKASAILDAVRSRVAYVSDPVDAEFMASPRHTLCLGDDGDLCMLAGDCDDLVIAFIACCESVGIRCCAVGHSYTEDKDITHVLAAADVGGAWMMCDPATQLPGGSAYQPTRELFIAVPSGEVLCDGSPTCNIAPGSDVVGGRTNGDFVGVAGPPEGTSMEATPEWKQYYLAMNDGLKESWNRAADVYAGMQTARSTMNRDAFDAPFVPSERGLHAPRTLWTEDDDKNFRSMHDMVAQMVQYGDDVRSGARKLVFADDYSDVGVLGEAKEAQFTVSATDSISATNFTPTTNGAGTLSGAFLIALAANPLVAGAVAVVAVVGTIVVLWKYVDAYQDTLKRVQTTDLLEFTKKCADDLVSSGVPREKALQTCTTGTKAVTEASAALTRANDEGKNKSELAGFTDLLKLGLWLVGAVVVIKGGMWAYDELKTTRTRRAAA